MHKVSSHIKQEQAGFHHHGIVHNLWIAFVLNASFTVIEFIGGWWTGSVAILSDALHDLGDTIIILFAILMEKWAQKPPTKRYPYGLGRLSPLGGLSTSFVLLIGSVVIIYMSILRFFNPVEVMASGMFFLAILGIVFNGLAVYRLRSSESVNQNAVKLHLMEDVLGWIAILLGSIVIWIWGWVFIDPLLSVLIGLYIGFNAGKNGWKALKIFLQSAPDKIDVESLKQEILTIQGILEIKSIKIWSIDGVRHVCNLIVLTDSSQVDGIRSEIKNKVGEKNIQECIVEILSTST